MENKLTFDEFFKLMAKRFFSLFGYTVQTELELFKLPKRIDVVVLHTRRNQTKMMQQNFTVFDYFRGHNIISFKSFKDNFSQKDIFELVIYFLGYVNAEKTSKIENTTGTIIVTHLPQKVRELNGFRQIAPGKYVIAMGLFSLYLIHINELEMKSEDAYFLLAYGKSERLHEYLPKLFSEKFKVQRNKKLVDTLNELHHIRIQGYEDIEIWRDFMPQVLEADITQWVKPHYDKGLQRGLSQGLQRGRQEGRQEGQYQAKLESAKNFYKSGVSVDIISAATGLSKAELKKIGVK